MCVGRRLFVTGAGMRVCRSNGCSGRVFSTEVLGRA